MRIKHAQPSRREPPGEMASEASAKARMERFKIFFELLESASRFADSPTPGSNLKPRDLSPADWAQHLIDALLNRLVSRVPKPGCRCPFTGLNRNQLYELFAQIEDERPLVKNVSLKKGSEKNGARFFFVGSALAYLEAKAAEQESATSSSSDALR